MATKTRFFFHTIRQSSTLLQVGATQPTYRERSSNLENPSSISKKIVIGSWLSWKREEISTRAKPSAIMLRDEKHLCGSGQYESCKSLAKLKLVKMIINLSY